MSFASRYHNLLCVFRFPALAGVVLMGCVYAWLQAQLPKEVESASSVQVSPPDWSALPAKTELDWSVFRGDGEGIALGQPDFAKAFRFAGTFFLSGTGGREIRKAVLSIVDEGRQVIASEGDLVGDVTVARIFQERVILERGAETAELRLSFVSAGGEAGTGAGGDGGEGDSSSSRFGEQLREDSWVLKRSALLAYYKELLDAPERLLQVFDSLKPIYTEDGKIEGYHLGIEGEGEFFNAVGFNEGDVVRKVNSLEMTSRNRAEFFIRQVVDNKLNAVVIDIERGGSARRLVYQIR